MTIRTGLIGFGTAGQAFHAPFIDVDPDYSLDVVVTGDAGRAADVRARYPSAAVVPSTDDLFDLASRLDLVVVASPPVTHGVLAHTSLDRGLAVVVDKPMCLKAAGADELADHADRAGLPLTVFHNRRWDGDFLTLRALLDDGALGQVRRFESRFEFWKPSEPKVWKRSATPAEGGGVLYDLGPHLIDQAVQLFGPVESVHGELAQHRADGGADDDAFVSLLHAGGVRSHLVMSAVAPQPGPRFTVVGSEAGFTKWGVDVQEKALKAGVRPDAEGFGAEPESAWGVLTRDGVPTSVPSRRGDYGAFYRELAGTLQDGRPVPVDPRDAAAVLAVIEQVHAAS